MHSVRTQLKYSAWVFAALAFAFIAAAGAPHQNASPAKKTAEITADYPGKKSTLSGNVKSAPFIRSASRTQSGLRSKSSTDPSGKARAELEAKLPVFASAYARRLEAKTPFPSSYISQRALGPRAPPIAAA